MSTFFADPVMSAALWITLKVSLVLGASAIVQALLYRRLSAAARHLVWILAIAGVLLLPMLSLALPDWPVVIRTAASRLADRAPAIDRVGQPVDLARLSTPLAMSS